MSRVYKGGELKESQAQIGTMCSSMKDVMHGCVIHLDKIERKPILCSKAASEQCLLQ